MSAERAHEDLLTGLEASFGHRFDDRRLLEQALRHASMSHDLEQAKARGASAGGDEDRPEDARSNERLEFLGDAVLGLVVAEALYRRHPDWREGELTRASHALVEGPSLAARARALGVGPALALGRTEQSSGGADKDSILENAFEAIIGAIYLDGGLRGVQRVVDRVFGERLSGEARPVERDPKTALQEELMSAVGEFPTYRLVHDNAIEGDDQRFEVEVESQGRVLCRGVGRTKRAAEKSAAVRALEQLHSEASGDD